MTKVIGEGLHQLTKVRNRKEINKDEEKDQAVYFVFSLFNSDEGKKILTHFKTLWEFSLKALTSCHIRFIHLFHNPPATL